MTKFEFSQADSLRMSRIRGADTKYEILVRSALHGQGFRFRKNDRRYPGSPDVLLPKYLTAIFIHGCFWHGHSGCKYATVPKTRTEFWIAKIDRNRKRDREKEVRLQESGFRVITIWECELKADFSEKVQRLINEIRG